MTQIKLCYLWIASQVYIYIYVYTLYVALHLSSKNAVLSQLCRLPYPQAVHCFTLILMAFISLVYIDVTAMIWVDWLYA